jgi:uncharacterized protein YbjT (DUF2867 family)
MFVSNPYAERSCSVIATARMTGLSSAPPEAHTMGAMRVLITGARGFIGRHLAAALAARGHAITAAGRPQFDFERPRDWTSALRGIDVVVNAAGVLRAPPERFEAIHHTGPRALFTAAEAAGVRRVLQISALGADEAAVSAFHLSKRRADAFLAQRALDWAIVQPSLVFGADGRSARWLAVLASLPLVPLPGDGAQRVQPIHVDDLAELLVRLVEAPGPIRETIAAVGPAPLALRDYLRSLRAQMGLGAARFVPIPLRLVPLDRETLGMLERGNTAPAARIGHHLGRAPRAPEAFIESGGVALQAKLDWLLPLLRGSIALVWILSGVVSLGLYPVADSFAMLARVGLTGAGAALALYGAALLDIALGVASLALRRRRWLWRTQLALIVLYSVIIAWRLPELWLHPFGPLVKNLPMLAAIALLHELDER